MRLQGHNTVNHMLLGKDKFVFPKEEADNFNMFKQSMAFLNIINTAVLVQMMRISSDHIVFQIA